MKGGFLEKTDVIYLILIEKRDKNKNLMKK